MSKFIKYDIQYTTPASATKRTAAIYKQMKADLMGGMAPAPEPFTVHSPSEDVLAGAWMILRESLLAGHVDHGLKQSVATAISQINTCQWCVDAHSIVMNAAGYGDVVQTLLEDKTPPLDAYTQKVMAWAQATRQPNAEIIHEPPFSREDMPEIIGTAVTFHYLNRVVNIVLEETPLPQQAFMKSAMKRVGALLFKWVIKNTPAQGNALSFLPDADLPADLAWAEGDPSIAGAFARFAAVIDEVESRLPLETVALLKQQIAEWDGTDPGLSRQWVTDAVARLPQAQQPVATLALLTAFAPHQVSDSTITAYRTLGHDDRDLIDLLAWASFSLARHIGVWLAQPFVLQKAYA